LDGAGVHLRSAETEDAPAIQALWREILDEDRWFIEMSEEHQQDSSDCREDLLRLLSEPHSRVWVAELRGLVVGVCRLLGGGLVRTRHVASLELFVSQDLRGQGLGRLLLEALITEAEADQVLQRLELNVFADNDSAIHLYRALGFREEGRRHGAVREPDGRLRDILLMMRWV
jgi:ribosomal protein S18 acetylase RimI-like enzyme